MNHPLTKKYKCPCGKIKRIKWEEKKHYEHGQLALAVGHSECPNCGAQQVHFSGNPSWIQQFIEESGMNKFGIDGLELDKRPFH